MVKRGLFVLLFIILFLIISVSAFNFNKNIFAEKNVLRVTDEHPFLVSGKWLVASELNVGDELLNVDGKKARIISIKDVNENVNVYNLEAEEYNDFIVGEGVIVHNSNRPIEVPEISDTTRAKFANHEQRTLDEVYSMGDAERLAYAESRVGEFSDVEKEAILYAHYNLDTIAAKARYLESQGIGRIERDILLSEGVCGNGNALNIFDISGNRLSLNINSHNTIIPSGIEWSHEIEEVQRIFTRFQPEGKIESMFLAGYIDADEYTNLMTQLGKPNRDFYRLLRDKEDGFFSSPEFWNDGGMRVSLLEVVDQLSRTQNDLLFFHLSEERFYKFVSEAKVHTEIVNEEFIMNNVDSMLRPNEASVGAKYNTNFYVVGPEEAEKIGRELLNKYVVDPYGLDNLDMVSSHYAIELKNPQKPTSYIGRIRRDLQGDLQNFPLRDGSEAVMQLPPHINVEIPRAKVLNEDGTYTEVNIDIHIFYLPV